MPMTWHAAAHALSTPFFDGIRPILRELDGDSWPTLTKLNELAAKYRVVNSRNVQIQFLPPTCETISALRYSTTPLIDIWSRTCVCVLLPLLRAASRERASPLLFSRFDESDDAGDAPAVCDVVALESVQHKHR